MVNLEFFKVLSVPTTWEPNSVYFVLGSDGQHTEMYVTGSNGFPEPVGNLAYLATKFQSAGGGGGSSLTDNEIAIVRQIIQSFTT